MKDWQSGSFDRSRIHPVYHPFAPAHAAENLESVSLRQLWDQGKRLILLDVDNTLVQWRGENFSEPVLAWVNEAKAMGFELCIISNTRRVTRLSRLSEILGVATVRGRFKPSRDMYRLALAKFRCRPPEAIMIGDQMMTDILGANRAGIDAIWVRKMDGHEFAGTRVNRFIEGLLTGPIYRAIVTPIDAAPASAEIEAAKPLAEKTLVQQIIKFAIVGGTSFGIDYCVRMTLVYSLHVGDEDLGTRFGRFLMNSAPAVFEFAKDDPHKAAYPFAAVIAGIVAGTNSFIFNRAWTFNIRGKEQRAEQIRRFVILTVSGNLLNVTLSSLFNVVIPGESKAVARIATILASLIVAVWNFVGQRLYAFRSKPK